MQNCTVLVTGGAGFIGSHLVQKLAEQGSRVKVIDNLSTGKASNISSALLSSGSVDLIEGDIRDAQTVKDCIAGVDAIVHLAAQTSVPFSVQNPSYNNDVNIKGTQNLLSSSVKENAAKFIFISSCAVYGESIYLPVDEKHPTNPISPYAESKLISEQNCLRLNSEGLLKSKVLRFFNVYGPRQGLNDYSGVITKFMDRIKQRLPLVIYGDGMQTRDFVYVKDVVNAIVLALGDEKASGEVFNIGTGRAISIQELAETMTSSAGINLGITKSCGRAGDIKHSYADISKAHKLLGYEPEFSLATGLKALLNANNLLNLESRQN